RPLTDGPYTFVAADALVMKVREGGRVTPIHTYVATGVNNGGHREILGLQVASSEDGAGWLAFFRGSSPFWWCTALLGDPSILLGGDSRGIGCGHLLGVVG